jgi:hypothetical protein
MPQVLMEISMSVDAHLLGPDVSPDSPMRRGGERLARSRAGPGGGAFPGFLRTWPEADISPRGRSPSPHCCFPTPRGWWR